MLAQRPVLPSVPDEALPARRPERRRRGAASVEFALVAPVLFLFVLGSIEFGRALMSLDLLANAARAGCRVGALPNTTNDDVTAAVNTFLSDAGIRGGTTAVTVNGQSADVASAAQGDQIEVTVTVHFSSVTWLPTIFFLGNSPLSGTVVMRKE